MADITAALVKELREKTGVGMMDCKKALSENDGDLEASVDWLRTQGMASAAKKAGRTASEGLIGIAAEGGRGALVEINAETDFVARNDTFQELVRTVTGIALAGTGDVEALKSADYPGGEGNVGETITAMIATIGENLDLRRTAALSVDQGVVAADRPNALTPGLGMWPRPTRRLSARPTWIPPNWSASAMCLSNRRANRANPMTSSRKW